MPTPIDVTYERTFSGTTRRIYELLADMGTSQDRVWPFAWIVAVLVVVILVLCARAGRRALAEGLSLHAAAHAELATPSAPTSWSTT